MKKNFLFLLFLFITQIIFSQADYRKGYIITNQGDTVPGLINYRESINAFSSCQYKVSENEPMNEYTPENIKGYGFINDKVYESRNLVSSKQSKCDTIVFYEVITRGPISLFRYEDDFYAQKGDTTFYRLYRGESVSNRGIFPIVVYGNKHLGILKILMSDSPESMQKIPSVKYDELSLTRLVEGYNNEKNKPAISYKSGKPWLEISAGISGGAMLSKLYFKSEHNFSYRYLIGPLSQSTSPFADIEVVFSSPRISEHFALRTDFILYKETFWCYAIDDNTQSIERYYTTIKKTQLMIPVGLSYFFKVKKFYPYLNLAFTTTLSLNDIQDLRIESQKDNVITTSHLDKEIAPRIQTGFMVNAGVQRTVSKKINCFIELRYDESFGYNPDMTNLSSKTYIYQICAGIRTK